MPQGTVVPYERQLDQNLELAMSEGSLFFEGRGRVQESLRRITGRLDQLGIAYAVAGGMALFLQGYRRYTEDVDILVTPEGLQQIHEALDGMGYVRPTEKSKDLRDMRSGVRIEFLVSGRYPDDGKPKDIAFPDPATVAENRDGIRVVNLPTLVSLKLASGMTSAHRLKDIADVGELIQVLGLPSNLADQLHPFVRERYASLWKQLQRRYVRVYSHAELGGEAPTVEEAIARLKTLDAVLAGALGDVAQIEAVTGGGAW